MLYHLYDIVHAALTPARLSAHTTKLFYNNPFNPLAHTQLGRTLGAGAELFERTTRRFGKPEFELHETTIGGRTVEVVEETVMEKPFCTLTRFRRRIRRSDPKVLVVAPLSGHFATLLRGTVAALLPHHEVHITEWTDARQVPLSEGRFNLDDYVDYLIEFIRRLGPDVHVIAVCQPAVPVLIASSLLASWDDSKQPLTMTLMGGPIDPRVSKTAVTELAEQRPLSWFEQAVVTEVPFYYPGGGRQVYPGFIQLGGFMSMNLDRHVGKHLEFFQHLIEGDGDSAASHRKFYNEYLAVMDITAEFYLQTVEEVFQKHSLSKNEMKWRNPKSNHLHDVKPSDIKKTALLTIEGELDDISALGQTMAAHNLCSNLAASKQFHHMQENVGHYGIFNGRRWRQHIMPRVRGFIRKFDKGHDPIPLEDLKDIPARMPVNWNESKHGIEAVTKRLAEKAKKNKKKPAKTKKVKKSGKK